MRQLQINLAAHPRCQILHVSHRNGDALESLVETSEEPLRHLK